MRRAVLFLSLVVTSFFVVTAVLAQSTSADDPVTGLPFPGPYPYLFPLTHGYFIHPNCLSENQGQTINGTVVQCGIPEIMLSAINIGQAILGIVGSVTLLMFVYGGVVWLTSAGNSERVQKGKNIFIGTLVGLAIIFCSSIIITFVAAALTGQTNPNNVQLFVNQGAPSAPPLTIPSGTNASQ